MSSGAAAADFDFITDRLAIGNVASRATPGFVAVVSILATYRPGTIACEVTGAPEVPTNNIIGHNAEDGVLPGAPIYKRIDVPECAECSGCPDCMTNDKPIPVLHIDLADGECHSMGPATDRHGKAHPSRGLEDYLDDATSFIAAHIRRGCVLVHCGAGKSRSVAVVVAYLCRYAGMSLQEAQAFVSARRSGACPAPCFVEAIKRWLHLDELTKTGPRR